MNPLRCIPHAVKLACLATVLSALPWSASAFVGAGISPAPAPITGSQGLGEGMTDRIIVKYRDASAGGTPTSATLGVARVAGNRQGVSLSHLRRTQSGADVMSLNRNLSMQQARALAEDLKSGDSNVEYAEPDRVLNALFVPNDSYYSQQWDYFDAVGGLNLPTAWDKSTGKGVVVAVLDTGIRPHADLAANLLPGYDFISTNLVSNDGTGRDADPSDPGDATTAGLCYSGSPASKSSWHGTHVAGTIAAVSNNGSGIAGVAFGAKVLPVRVLGRCGGYTSDIADAIIWASGGAVAGVPANANPARVINMSLGGSGACDTTTQNAINSARSRGTVVVVAAGNSNANAAQFSPASCTGVITVAATGKTGGKASYSNFGANVTVAAPGGDGGAGILSTLNAGTSAPGADSYASYMGTSMATPHVAGVVALMLSRNSALKPDDVASKLKSTARAFPATCSQCGSGIVNASAAVDAAAGTTPAPAPAPAPTPAPAPAPTPAPAPAPAPVGTVKEAEPNDLLAQAQAIATFPTTVGATIGSTTDTDYYKLTIPAGAKVLSTMTPNATSNYDLYLYTSSGALLTSSVRGTGLADAITVSNVGTAAAVVYFRVVRVAGLTGTTATYTMAFTK
jgi:serine protease